MQRQQHHRGLLATLLATLLVAWSPTPARAADPVRVLFIGNSFTYYHDLPKMVAGLAQAAAQRPLLYERQTPGGCTLEKHWKDGKALAKLQAGRWDYVVLQEHSGRPLDARDKMFEYAKKFHTAVQKQGGKTLLYLTWARRTKPDTQSTISKAYQDLAGELHSGLAPVGIAWDMALSGDKQLVLHDKDGHHPNPAGTYLAACVFYATLYGKSPEGLPGKVGGLTDAEARPLQTIAWKAVEASAKKSGKD